MANERVRFIHATQLDLDEPLVGSGPLTGDDRRLAEDATLISLSRLVDACVDRAVDFFLLTGNAFTGGELSLRAKSAIEAALRRLDDNNIPSFVLPGHTDPPSAWSGIRTPDSVTIFDANDDEPTDLVSDGRTLATIIPLVGAHGEEAHWDFLDHALQTARGLKIGLIAEGAPLRWDSTGPLTLDRSPSSNGALAIVQQAIAAEVDYIGFGGNGARRTIRSGSTLIHSPGPSQSRFRRGIGPHGCTVVESKADGTLVHELVKTAPVRWEALPVEVRPGVSFDELVQKMAVQLVDREVGQESMWLVQWIVRGSGELFDLLGESKTQRELWEFLDEEVRTEGVRRHHLLTREPPVEDGELETTNLFLEYTGAISDQLQPGAAEWKERGKVFESVQAPWASSLNRVVYRMDPEHVGYESRRLARLWWT